MQRTPQEEIALAILLWRFTGHHLVNGWRPDMPSIDRGFKALELAKVAGVKREYLRAMSELPILTVKVKELGE